MTAEERMSIIEHLALVKNYNPVVFDNVSDEDLLKELKACHESRT